MAPEHDGNQVSPPVVPGQSAQQWAPCPHGLRVYTSGENLVHVGNGTVCQEDDAQTAQFDKVPADPSAFHVLNAPDYAPVFGFNDSNGKSLVEFRVRDGYVEAKYYPSDLDDAARRFIDYMMSLQDG